MKAYGRTMEDTTDVSTRVYQRSSPLVIVVNDALRVLGSSVPSTEEDEALAALVAEANGSLPVFLRPTVRRMTAVACDDTAPERIALAQGSLLVRVIPILVTTVAPVRLCVVLLERYHSRDYLSYAVKRFGMSRREQEVLKLALDGQSAAEIADALSIATSTAEDHLRRLLIKTGARNRADMIARVLGWGAGSSLESQS